MVSSKKIKCAYCNKKCSGNVLRYQNRYYHKQCFELEQRDSATAIGIHDSTDGVGVSSQQQLDRLSATGSSSATGLHRSSDLVDGMMSQSQSQSQSIAQPMSDSQFRLTDSQSATSQQNISTNNGSAPGRSYRSPMDSNQHQQRQQKSNTIGTSSGQRQADAAAAAAARSASNYHHHSATLPHSTSAPTNGFLPSSASSSSRPLTSCAGCSEKIRDGQALIALDLHWHVWCFKCTHCKIPLHGEYVAKDGKAYCERDYQKLFGVVCVYCKRYITGKVLQAGEAHHFHPSCARCSKCGDPFVPGEEMYLQGEVTWHPRCGPGPDTGSHLDELANLDASSRSQLRASRNHSPSLSSLPRSRSASPYSYFSRQCGRASPNYADSEAVGDLSRIYTISYLNADPNQGYLRRPIEPYPPKSPQFSRPTSRSRADQQSRCSSRSQYNNYGGRERSVPRGMYSVLSSMRSGSSTRARSPSMMNEEAIQMAQYPSGQKPSPDSVPKIERDDFPAPPFKPDRSIISGKEQPVAQKSAAPQQQQRASRPRSREMNVLDDSNGNGTGNGDNDSANEDPQLRKEEEELSKIANGIGKIFLQTLKEREKLRAWKRANLDPRNASRTPSATRELPNKPLRYDNPLNASPSRDLDRPRPWEEDGAVIYTDGSGGEQQQYSPTRPRSPLGRSQMSSSTYGYRVVQSNRSTPKPGYGLGSGGSSAYCADAAAAAAAAATTTPGSTLDHQQQSYYNHNHNNNNNNNHHRQTTTNAPSDMSFVQQQRIAQARSTDLLMSGAKPADMHQPPPPSSAFGHLNSNGNKQASSTLRPLSSTASSTLRRSMPNVSLQHHIHSEGPPKLYPYHLLATTNYRLPPDVDRCHLERHLSNEEFQYIFHCDRIDFYRMPEWKRNELKRRARLF